MLKKSLIISALCIALVAAGLFFERDKLNTHANSNKAVFTGVNLSCNQCENRMDQALSKIIGIKEYKMNPAEKTVTVTFDHNVMKAEWIENSLKSAGFNPKGIEY
ncbi:copper chaperone CopZ [Scopulibacillus daqui]|uniref:Copper chaperone CopZ n=1 Tax=Scopulibacillus daqui TaxID=1469162 RepID=A0ABS2PZJ0_9BACL|nr:heavy-metal-associated domain-containing protein [Scopulibacillus daqui]MBM7644985.1 copper chaperone CopZ [Scopulibacillus daqui]